MSNKNYYVDMFDNFDIKEFKRLMKEVRRTRFILMNSNCTEIYNYERHLYNFDDSKERLSEYVYNNLFDISNLKSRK